MLLNLLDRADLFIADHPVRVESHVQDVIQLLLIGIWAWEGLAKEPFL